MYDNQEIIDEENRKLKEVDPDWSISSLGLCGNKAISIGITVPIKGNAGKIKRLESDGWKRTFRKKMNDGYGAFSTSENHSGSMIQCMRKEIRED